MTQLVQTIIFTPKTNSQMVWIVLSCLVPSECVFTKIAELFEYIHSIPMKHPKQWKLYQLNHFKPQKTWRWWVKSKVMFCWFWEHSFSKSYRDKQHACVGTINSKKYSTDLFLFEDRDTGSKGRQENQREKSDIKRMTWYHHVQQSIYIITASKEWDRKSEGQTGVHECVCVRVGRR